MKISGIPNNMTMVMLFDPDDIEKVSVCKETISPNHHSYSYIGEVGQE
jgi:hypothetical protein